MHNSLSVEKKSATLVCGQFPFLSLWQNEASGDTFLNAVPLYAHLYFSSLLLLLPPSPCIPPVMGLTDTRHQQVLRPRWIRFPTCQGIVLHVHFYGLVLHSWRFSVQLWCAAVSDNH